MIRIAIDRPDGATLFVDINQQTKSAALRIDRSQVAIMTLGPRQTAEYVSRWYAGEIDHIFDNFKAIKPVGRPKKVFKNT